MALVLLSSASHVCLQKEFDISNVNNCDEIVSMNKAKMAKSKRKRPRKDRLAKRFRGRNKFESALKNYAKCGGSGNVASGDLPASPQPPPRSPSSASSSSSSFSLPSPLPGPTRQKRVRRPIQDYETESPDSESDSPGNVASLANAMSEASIGGEVWVMMLVNVPVCFGSWRHRHGCVDAASCL